MITALACVVVGYALSEIHARWVEKSDEIDAVLNATREDR